MLIQVLIRTPFWVWFLLTALLALPLPLPLHPAWQAMGVVQLPLALAFGCLSGIFLGRALGLWALTGRPLQASRLHRAA